MKVAFKAAILLSLLLLVTAFSYSLAMETDITVSGDMKTAVEALGKAVLKNGGQLIHSPDGKVSWYLINGVGLTFTPATEFRIHVKASVAMGTGCGHSKAKELASELLAKLVVQASHESRIEMRISEIKEAGTDSVHR